MVSIIYNVFAKVDLHGLQINVKGIVSMCYTPITKLITSFNVFVFVVGRGMISLTTALFEIVPLFYIPMVPMIIQILSTVHVITDSFGTQL
jgi:hypothetical protein